MSRAHRWPWGRAWRLRTTSFEARFVHLGLVDFLRAGSTGFYEDLARESRLDRIVGLQWLGVELRPLPVFALIYAVLRVCTCRVIAEQHS